MKKDKESIATDKPESATDVKKALPAKTKMTDSIKNTASQTPGLNQANTTRDDLLPSDGDNLTN